MQGEAVRCPLEWWVHRSGQGSWAGRTWRKQARRQRGARRQQPRLRQPQRRRWTWPVARGPAPRAVLRAALRGAAGRGSCPPAALWRPAQQARREAQPRAGAARVPAARAAAQPGPPAGARPRVAHTRVAPPLELAVCRKVPLVHALLALRVGGLGTGHEQAFQDDWHSRARSSPASARSRQGTRAGICWSTVTHNMRSQPLRRVA